MGHAYVVGHVRVKDDGKWRQYQERVPATLAPWGAELMFRARKAQDFSGALPHTDIVVIRFLDADSAGRWFASDAYQALIALRQEAAEVLLHSWQA